MYPFIRYAKELLRYRHAPALGLWEEHVTTLVCWPWDIDFWWEMNNGRTLTLYDLGRIPHLRRIGLMGALERNGWGLAVAGSAVRYRRRVTTFQRLTLRSRILGWDERFLYTGQDIWLGEDCANAAVLRIALLENRKMIPPARVLAEMGHPGAPPPLPDWIAAWAAAEALRPWPP